MAAGFHLLTSGIFYFDTVCGRRNLQEILRIHTKRIKRGPSDAGAAMGPQASMNINSCARNNTLCRNYTQLVKNKTRKEIRMENGPVTQNDLEAINNLNKRANNLMRRSENANRRDYKNELRGMKINLAKMRQPVN